jgi:hypothetical protein
VADSVFEKNGGSQVDSLRLRAETALDLQDFARWRPRPRARLREACEEIDVTRRSNDLLSMTQLEKTSVQGKNVMRPILFLDTGEPQAIGEHGPAALARVSMSASTVAR